MTWPLGLLQKGKYGAIYADPAWPFQGYLSVGIPQTKDEQHYKPMTMEDMAALPVNEIAAPNCALFMWGISSHAKHAFWLANEWGFEFSSKAFCWAKLNKNAEANAVKQWLNWSGDGDDESYPKLVDNKNWFMGMGHSTRRNTEDCWLFTRGKPKRLDKGVRELVVSPIREHSRKPDEVYDRIEKLVAGPYCELFSRSTRKGWSTWGNEKGKFDD